MEKPFTKYTLKHTATVFKYALKSLPLPDRRHVDPLPPCPGCGSRNDNHQHLIECQVANQAWQIAKQHAIISLGSFSEGLVEVWTKNKLKLNAHYAAATLHGLWWHRCGNLKGTTLTLQEAILTNLKKMRI